MRIEQLPILMMQYLLLTIVVEVLVAFLLGIRGKKNMVYVVLVNIITNPILNASIVYLEYQYGRDVRNLSLAIFEVVAFLVEGWIYFRCLDYKKKNGFFVSFILNVSSYLMGTIINSILYR